jgi:2TM domain-containing protein
MENEILYRRAAVRAAMQIAFYRHVMIYIIVNALLVAVNLLKDPNHLWFQWGLLGWGIGLLVHGLNVYSYRWFGSRREQMIQRELERQRKNSPQS